MILDKSILRQIHLVDTKLTNDINTLASDSESNLLFANTKGYKNESQIENLQNALQQLKVIVGKHVQATKGKSSGNHTAKTVDLSALSEIIGKLPPITIEMLQDLLNCGGNDGGSSSIERVLMQAIIRYTLILCYYSVVAESLLRLPSVRDTEQYFVSVSSSLQNKLLYLLQTSVTKLVSLVKYVLARLKIGAPRGSGTVSCAKLSSYTDLTQIETTLREIPHALKRLYERDVQPRINKMLMLQKFQFVGLPRWENTKFLVFGIPRLLVEHEIETKYNYVSERSKFFVRTFGELLSTFPNNNVDFTLSGFTALKQFLKGMNPLSPEPVSLYDIVLQTRLYVESVNPVQQASLEKPSFIVRYWPIGLVLFANGPSLVSQVWGSRYKILGFLDQNVWQFLRGLVINWVWIPLKDIWATVKHDEGSQIAMMSSGMLDTEMDSLCRMLTKFLNENSGPGGGSAITQMEVMSHIKHGDLDEFMRIYESEIHNPIKNILTGRLITSLLIQVQKTKVDGSLALNGIDQMLKSQQLVFAFVALSPATLLLYLLVSSLLKFIKMGTIWSNVRAYKLKLSRSLNNIERILNYGEQTDLKFLSQGLLIMETSNLSTYGNVVIPKNRRDDWSRDIEELVNINFSNVAKLNVVNRIYHVYGKYF